MYLRVGKKRTKIKYAMSDSNHQEITTILRDNEIEDEYDGNDIEFDSGDVFWLLVREIEVRYTNHNQFTFPAPVLEPDLDDAVFSDVFSNLNTGLPKKKLPANKTEIPPQNEPKQGPDNKTARLNELLRDCNARARELNERLRAINATMRERLGQ